MQGQFSTIIYYTRKTVFSQANFCDIQGLSALKVSDFFVNIGYSFQKDNVILYMAGKEGINYADNNARIGRGIFKSSKPRGYTNGNMIMRFFIYNIK